MAGIGAPIGGSIGVKPARHLRNLSTYRQIWRINLACRRVPVPSMSQESNLTSTEATSRLDNALDTSLLQGYDHTVAPRSGYPRTYGTKLPVSC